MLYCKLMRMSLELVVEDEKVSIDDLQGQIEGDEDHVQSTDVVSGAIWNRAKREPTDATTPNRPQCRSFRCLHEVSSISNERLRALRAINCSDRCIDVRCDVGDCTVALKLDYPLATIS